MFHFIFAQIYLKRFRYCADSCTALLIFKTFLIVKEASAAVIERFGKFQSIRKSGLSLVIPFIDNERLQCNLRVQQLDVTIETKTLDNVFVNLQVSVQYQVRREFVKEAYYSLDNAKNQIASMSLMTCVLRFQSLN